VTARAIVSGVIFKAPQTKTSKAGKPYAIATIREGTGERVRWWKAFVFNEFAIEEILRLGDGDPIAVSGEFDCELWTPEGGGESRLSWKITADAVLSARTKPKIAKLQDSRQPLETKRWEGGPNDGVPF
jgi:hypothetical protein